MLGTVGTCPKGPTLVEQMGKMEVEVHSLAQAVGTRYLGKFPHFFEWRIIPSLENTNTEFYIACDFPNYAFFSAYPVHLAFIDSLKKKAKRIKIHGLFLQKDRRQGVTRLQMPKTIEEWNKQLQDAAFALRLSEFCERVGKPINSPTELEEERWRMHDFGLSDFRAKIATSCDEVDSPMPIYIWIADRRRAIFSIPQFGPEPTEHGFETTNQDLVDSLLLLWQRYKGA